MSVVLTKSQDAAGISTVVQGPLNEGKSGTSLGASLRRFHEPNGITFRLPDGSIRPYRGWLIMVAADTLAAAELIGFKKSFGPKVKSFCWQCDAGNGQRSHCASSFLDGRDCQFTARDPSEYRRQRRHCRTLSRPQQIIYMKSIGINSFRHAYTRIPHFQVIQYVPRDLMHVELEGNLKVPPPPPLSLCSPRAQPRPACHRRHRHCRCTCMDSCIRRQ